MTVSNEKQGPQSNAVVDFETSRGYSPMGAGLNRNFLTFDKLLVGATIAALYHNPEDGEDAEGGEHGPRRSNRASRAMVSLALYASGSAVTLNRQQFRSLERRVRRYASEMAAPMYENANNLGFARWVLKHAVKRAKTEKVI